MPWSYPDNIPRPAKNWPAAQQKACIAAGNRALAAGRSEEDAIFACIGAAEQVRDNSGGRMAETFTDREASQKAAQARAKRYGIAVKEKGNLTPPQGYPSAESEYGDPVNYKYPADAKHASAALGYFNQSEHRTQGGYSTKEWGIIGARLARLISRHLSGAYSYKSGRLVTRDESSALHWVDLFAADRVLAGERVRLVPLMPKGFVRMGMRKPPITSETIETIVDNWKNRATSGMYLTQLPVTIEHQPGSGRIGVIADVEAGEDGVYGRLSLTPRGQQMLGEQQFAYLSPEIRWKTTDVESGKDLGPSLAGVSVTNYPFFGDRTAMYSEDVQRQWEEQAAEEGFALGGSVPDVLDALAEVVAAMNWVPSDLVFRSDAGYQAVLGPDALAQNRNGGLLALASAAKALPDQDAQRELFELFVVTRDEEGEPYPRSAYARGQAHDPDTWALRLKGYNDGRLVPEQELLEGAAAQDLLDADDPAWVEIFSACTDLEIDPTSLLGGLQMPGEDNGNRETTDQEVRALTDQLAGLQEQFSQAQDNYQSLLGERDALIQQQGVEIDRLTTARLRDGFSHRVEAFNAIGAERDELTDHLLWLYQVDDTEGREHFAYFEALLETMNGALAESEAFRSRGVVGQPAPADEHDAIEKAVQAKAKELGISAEPGTEQYNDVLMQVLRDQSELFAAYRESVTGA